VSPAQPAAANDFEAAAAAIRWLVLDVDGVLTDGRLYYGPDGEALKVFDVKDGFAIKESQRRGLHVAVISARSSPAAARRCEELGIDVVHLGVADKKVAFDALLEAVGCRADEVAAIGDDLPDLAILKNCRLSFAPADAAAQVRAACNVTVSRPGGRGAVREMIERILAARGEWPS
jgi:3-deoxy-D-manno-octulosonate 8-phosphate phosphatase (KDO 8-P phosphatase)